MDEEIERLVHQLGCMNPEQPEYAKTADNLKILCEARSMKNDRSISSEALLAVAANLIGILVILNFEKTGVITTKALSFLGRKS